MNVLDALAERIDAQRDESEPMPPRFQFLTVDELLSEPRPQWLIRRVLPRAAMAVLYGESGSGKTFLALHIAAQQADGGEIFGQRTTRSGVVYVGLEGALRNRIEAYLKTNELADLSNLRIFEGSVNLLDPKADVDDLVLALLRVREEIGDVGLVIIDTLNRAMPGGNENASEDMGAVIAAARRISQKTGAAVMFVHHSGKDVTKGSRGHSSLKAAADLEIEVTKTESGERVAELTKVKDAECGSRFGFRLVPVDLGPCADADAHAGEREGSCIVVPTDAPARRSGRQPRRDVAFDALRESISNFGVLLPETSTIPHGVRTVTLDQWRARWVLRTGYEDSTANSAKVNFHKDKDALLKAGRIGISKPHVWIA